MFFCQMINFTCNIFFLTNHKIKALSRIHTYECIIFKYYNVHIKCFKKFITKKKFARNNKLLMSVIIVLCFVSSSKK